METYKGNVGDEPELHESLHDGVTYRRWDDNKGPLRLPQFVISRTDLANFFHSNAVLIDRWRQQGCPVFEPPTGEVGSTYKYYLPDVVDWRICIGYLKYNKTYKKSQQKDQEDPTKSPKGRAAMAKARMAELELAERLGEVMPTALIGRAWQEAFSIVKTRCLALAPFMAPQLAPAMHAAKVEMLLQAEITKILEEVSGAGLPEKLRDSVAEFDGGYATATETDNQRVGTGETPAQP